MKLLSLVPRRSGSERSPQNQSCSGSDRITSGTSVTSVVTEVRGGSPALAVTPQLSFTEGQWSKVKGQFLSLKLGPKAKTAPRFWF